MVIRELLDLIVDFIDINKERKVVFFDRLEILDKCVDVWDSGRTFDILEGTFVFLDDGIERIIRGIAEVAAILF